MGNLFKQMIFHAETVSLFLLCRICIFRLIQSQSQPRAASTARCQENANEAGSIAVEVGIQLFFRGIRYRNHNGSPVLLFPLR